MRHFARQNQKLIFDVRKARGRRKQRSKKKNENKKDPTSKDSPTPKDHTSEDSHIPKGTTSEDSHTPKDQKQINQITTEEKFDEFDDFDGIDEIDELNQFMSMMDACPTVHYWPNVESEISVPALRYNIEPHDVVPIFVVDIPIDTLLHTAKFLAIRDIVVMTRVNKLFRDISTRSLYLLRVITLQGSSIQDAMRITHRCPKLREMHLHGLVKAEDVINTIKSCPNLDTVKIVGTLFERDSHIIAEISQHLPKLKHLQLACRDFSSSDLIRLAHNCTHLEDLRFWSYSSKPCNRGIRTLLKQCKHLFRLALFHFIGVGRAFSSVSPLLNLLNLCLHGCKIDDKHCFDIAKAAPKLKSLVLSFNWGISDRGVRSLIGGKVELNELRLENTSISADLLRELANARTCPKLKRLGVPVHTLDDAVNLMKAKPRCVVRA